MKSEKYLKSIFLIDKKLHDALIDAQFGSTFIINLLHVVAFKRKKLTSHIITATCHIVCRDIVAMSPSIFQNHFLTEIF